MTERIRQISIFENGEGVITRICAEWDVELAANGHTTDAAPWEDITDDPAIEKAAEKLRSLIEERGAPKLVSDRVKNAAAEAKRIAVEKAAVAAEQKKSVKKKKRR